MSRLATVLLCCAVLAAGCAGFAADDTGTPSPVSVPEVTVPTPEATGTPTDRPRVVPGATRAGVVEPDTLVTAHVDRLRTASFLVSYERTVTDANGTDRRRVIDGRVDRSGNATTTWTALNVSGDPVGPDTGTGSDEKRAPSPSFRERLAPALSTVTLNRTTDPEGASLQTTTFHYRGTAERADLFGERVQNVSVLLQVEPTGVIMSYRLRYERVATGERVVEELDYGAVWFGND